ncbi:LysM domain-containing protein [Microbacterium sp. ARD31]|uniref:LysM peptidoglycan-binding domain-containing protein n=1 Tax=Microbacterium sp. ARD31 TaxID=2962576 RepID=UPI0028817BE6|nr:LysM domain-containing protein [Microbacterium sp. ARD31]MDT0187715.1 LysM domain-containing protein [Microbacterium sp. ARD31]
MSRAIHTILRPVAVWAAVSAAAALGAVAVPGAWRATGPRADVADLLVAVCATALAGSLCWLWVVTTATVAALLAGHRPSWREGATRRLVLVACGAAVVAGPALPAHAAGGEGADLLAGLPLPDRATAPTARREPRPATPAREAPGAYVVQPGDSLWSIARAHPARDLTVDERWRAIWRANHDVVGDDPDLILPGQALRLPADPTPPTDGDR